MASKSVTANKQAANSLKKPKREPTKGSFESGKSGNPSGRPKRTEEELDLIAACKVKAPHALEVIDRLMTTAKSDAVQLNAATFVIERAYGKAVQQADVKHSGSVGVTFSAEQATRIAQEILHGSK
jgi:hypothetical protein